jgi:hypothetical protein
VLKESHFSLPFFKSFCGTFSHLIQKKFAAAAAHYGELILYSSRMLKIKSNISTTDGYGFNGFSQIFEENNRFFD